MATFSGKGGSATFGANIFHVASWSLTQTCNVHDVTALGLSWQEAVAGIPGATFELTGFLDSASVSLPGHPSTEGVGVEAAVVLMQDTTQGYSGTALCTSMSVSVAQDGTADITASGVINGTLTQIAA